MDEKIEIKIDDRLPFMRVICNRHTASIIEYVDGFEWKDEDKK